MRADEIRKHVRKQPFEPFRIFLSNGMTYDVRHPELIYVSRSEVVVPVELADDDIAVRSAYCDPVHITTIELLNGAKPKRQKSKRPKSK